MLLVYGMNGTNLLGPSQSAGLVLILGSSTPRLMSSKKLSIRKKNSKDLIFIWQSFSIYLHVSNQKCEKDKPKNSYCYGKENLSWIGAGLKPLTKCTAEKKMDVDL